MKCALLILCVSFSCFCYGQKLKVGFRGGAAFSNFYGHHLPGQIPTYSIVSGGGGNPPVITPPGTNDSKPNYYYKTSFIKDIQSGFFSYLFLDIELKERLSMEAGLGYSQKGIDMKYSQQSTSAINPDNSRTAQSYQFDRNLRLDYLVVPVTFQYKLGHKQRFYVLGGVYNSFLVNFLIKKSRVRVSDKTYSASGQFMSEMTSVIIDDKTYAKIFDSGLIGGLGVNFPLSEKIILGLDLRSSIGLMSIPGKYEEHGFQSFSNNTKNISFETGVKVQYVLK